ncbi:MAG TPA: PEP-CTERM sorting domain-containing protein [Chthoniobacteraceae bacterium]|nr:PEP-CTERM sorting domain-containing protein [Chthoniobacteraceae bacterium]
MKTSFLLCLLSLALCQWVSAAVVVEYPFPVNVSSGAPVVYDARLSASNPSWVGVAPTYGFGGSAGNAYVGSTNKIAAFDSGKYLTFTVEAEDGFTLRLDAFHFDLGGSARDADLSVHVEIRTSVDGFAASLPLAGGGTVASRLIEEGNSTPVYSAFAVPLGDQFDNLTSITFRLHIYLETIPTSGWLRMDNFVLEGVTQAIPEPSAGWLLMVAAGGTFLITRRRFRNAL